MTPQTAHHRRTSNLVSVIHPKLTFSSFLSNHKSLGPPFFKVSSSNSQRSQASAEIKMVSSSQLQSSQQSPSQPQSNNTLGMLIVLGMVGASAGFTLYTKRTASMIKQLDQISKNKARRMPPPRIGPMTKAEWDKVRPRFDKDEFI